MTELKEGQTAPDFKLPSREGEIRLFDFKGKKNVVLYFYPKDDTPGCTKEACDFRDSLAPFSKTGTVILGMSADGVESHKKFQEKFRLPFNLVSDETKDVLKAYGVWKKKSFLGKTFMGIERTTFVIDKQGKIRRIFPKVKVDGHWQEVLEAVKGLEAVKV